MTLDEQLEELRNNMLRDNSDLVSGSADELWSDETLLRYIKDAERRFARRTLMLRDGTTPEVVQVRLRDGVKTYKLHDSVMAVLAARYDTNNYDMQRSGHALVQPGNPPEFLSFDPANPGSMLPGAPLAYFTDETLVFGRKRAVTMSFYPVPGAAEENKIVYMRVVRYPMTCYGADDLDKESEIPEDYQLDVLEWAAYLAMRGFDADTGSATNSDKHKAAFEEAIARAQMEMKRTIHANTGLAYGSNGFSWGR